jgi:hypothetical protein
MLDEIACESRSMRMSTIQLQNMNQSRKVMLRAKRDAQLDAAGEARKEALVIPAPWYAPLAEREGRGRDVRPGSLAGLAAARREGLGQFFSPPCVAAALWRLVEPSMTAALIENGGKIALLDTSVGTGRLLQFAHPQAHELHGCDVDGELIEALVEATEAAGFDVELVATGLESIRPQGYGVALINPPFSLPLQSPHLTPCEATTFGPFGPDTATTSHRYALAQALQAAAITAAILPRSYAETLPGNPAYQDHLHYLIHLPRGAFRQAGTEVDTSLVLLTREPGATLQTITLESLDDSPAGPVLPCPTTRTERPRLRRCGLEPDVPVITRPVTGERRVRIANAGRRVVLRFGCGLTEALVRNAIAEDDAAFGEGQRRPAGADHIGAFRLDRETYLVQDDPHAALQSLFDRIRSVGGDPEPAPGFLESFARKVRQAQIDKVPFRHVIQTRTAGAEESRAVARKTHLIDPLRWGAPLVRQGDELTFRREGQQWVAIVSGERYALEEATLLERFTVEAAQAAPAWTLLHAGKAERFPERARQAAARITQVGADAIASWDYQRADLVELLVAGGGVLAGEMGYGKTRTAIAICLAGGRRNAVLVEPRLVDEFVRELRACGIPEAQWCILRADSDLTDLRRITVIPYTVLRAPDPRNPRRLLASRLRRRFCWVVADEAHLLRRMESLQTRAVWMLSPKHRVALTGTAIANYPRDTIPILAWACGSATVRQPYGLHHRPHLIPRLLTSASFSERGIDAFADAFCTFEWVTHEFSEGLVRGGKREIPRLQSVEAFRDWVAPCLLRRRREEPEVARYFQRPAECLRRTEVVDFDTQHLRSYLIAADEFANYWKEQRKKQGEGKNINMIALLARINAVLRTASLPQDPPEGVPAIRGTSSKQRACVEQVADWVEQGERVLVFANFPGSLRIIQRELAGLGIDAVLVTGDRPIKARTDELNARFRKGDAPVVLLTYGCGQTGLNLPEAAKVALYDRSWSAKTEDQAIGRTLRPNQTRDVEAVAFELEGSIDAYCAQMIDAKRGAAAAGIDHAAQGDAEFLHLDRILDQFVTQLADLHGLKAHELREQIRRAA